MDFTYNYLMDIVLEFWKFLDPVLWTTFLQLTIIFELDFLT